LLALIVNGLNLTGVHPIYQQTVKGAIIRRVDSLSRHEMPPSAT
jgi:ribose/xylose/arabinose/galactoside ABC-type transport system permease subunit